MEAVIVLILIISAIAVVKIMIEGIIYHNIPSVYIVKIEYKEGEPTYMVKYKNEEDGVDTMHTDLKEAITTRDHMLSVLNRKTIKKRSIIK